MKAVFSSLRSRRTLALGIGAFLIAMGVVLHFVPIQEEKGFIAAEKLHEGSALTCEAILEHKRYRLSLNEMPQYEQTKAKFGKNVDGPCPRATHTTISLYIF
jgi:hypothetical protein